MFPGRSQFVPKRDSPGRQRPAGVLSGDALFVAPTAIVKEDGLGTKRGNGKCS